MNIGHALIMIIGLIIMIMYLYVIRLIDALLSDFDDFYDYKPITLRDLEYILNS